MNRAPNHCLVLVLGIFTSLGCATSIEPGEDSAQPGATETQQEIIGGAPATLGQLPWQVRLMRNGQQWCGGSLIGARWVLTAAHCVHNQTPANMNVVLGDLLINQLEPGEQTRTISRFIIHPQYGTGSGVNADVALVELNTNATLNANVATIALQQTPAINGNHTASGWGRTVGVIPQGSNALMVATLPVVPNASCNAAPLARDLFVDELCAGSLNGTTGGCFGDSGGPLTTQTLPLRVAGVVSWGSASCNSFTVFARVSTHAPWINSQVNCVQCPMTGSWFDGANCFRATPPAGTSPFVLGGNLYHSPVQTPTCPMSGSWFDGANCFRATAPAGTTPFVFNGNLYHTALPGNVCPVAGSWFDGANCFLGTAPAGTTPFVFSGNLYYSPSFQPTCPLAGSSYDGANCYLGTAPPFTTPFVYNGNLYYSPVCTP